MDPPVKSSQILTFRNGVILVTAFMLCQLAALVVLRDGDLRAAVNGMSMLADCLLVSGAFFYTARRTASYSKRLSLTWTTWALALLSFSAASILSLILEVLLQQRSSTSVADIFFLMSYPLFLTGILVLPAVRLAPGERLKVMLDMGIVMLSAVLIFWNFLFGPIITAGAPNVLTLAFSLAYPAGDLALLWGLFVLLSRSFNGQRQGPLWLIAGAILAMVLTDAVFGYQSLAGTYQPGGSLTMFGVLGVLLALLAAVWQVSIVQSRPGISIAQSDTALGRKPAAWRSVLSYTGLGAAFLLLVWGHDHPLPMSFPAVAMGVGGVIGLVLIRQMVALSENAHLSEQLQVELNERKQAAAALRQAHDELEARVQERTAQLAQANQELQRTVDWQTLLYEMLRTIGGQLNPNAVARLAVETIVKFTGWPHVCFAVPNQAGSDWVIQAAGGELAAEVGLTCPLSQGVIGRAFRTHQTQLVPDVRMDVDYRGENPVLLSELTVPIQQGERILAVLNLESDRPGAFGAEEKQLAESLAEAIALALENARLYEAAQIELSERRRIEVALLATRARLQHLLASSPTVIYSCEAYGDYAATYISENVEAQLGFEPVAYLNDARFWIDHIHPEDKQHVLTDVEHLFRDGHHIHEYRFLHKDGGYRWTRDEVKLVYDTEGRPIEMVGSWIDITERKEAEEKVQASLREKEVLLKEIHHRVKNNMQVVSSLLSLQANRVQDSASLEVLRESQNRVKSMALIHEKLYQSKDLAKVDFADYVRDLTMHLFRTYRTNAGAITLRINVSENVRLGVDTAIPCGLIVNELVSNALKYAFPGGRAGEVRVDLEREGGGELTLVVSDNGVGFPADVDPGHTGSLGLKLVTTLADQLEGSIELERSAGTLFKVTFAEATA